MHTLPKDALHSYKLHNYKWTANMCGNRHLIVGVRNVLRSAAFLPTVSNLACDRGKRSAASEPRRSASAIQSVHQAGVRYRYSVLFWCASHVLSLLFIACQAPCSDWLLDVSKPIRVREFTVENSSK